MDKLDAAFQAIRLATNQVLPQASRAMHQANQAIADLPSQIGNNGGGNNGGGNNGGGDTTGTNPAIEAVIAQANSKLGARYKLGAEGPNEFDCSGLVYWSFVTGGYAHLIGGNRLLAAGYAHWFANQGAFHKGMDGVQRGDVVFFIEKSGKVGHTGIALGNHRVISALINPYGVSRTRIGALNVTPYGYGRPAYPAQAAFQAADMAPGSTSDAEAEVGPDLAAAA